MSESEPQPPTPSPSPPLPPGPGPSEEAMALEHVRLYLLADDLSSRPQSPPLSPESETSETMEEPSPESSDSLPAAEPTSESYADKEIVHTAQPVTCCECGEGLQANDKAQGTVGTGHG
ncbi:hypothetical protein E4U30_003680 [Claviceps sp. LM220 group G6]|nr:hypothetical protein E4U30_003680 [Claviceps sp. LM220 group G6]